MRARKQSLAYFPRHHPGEGERGGEPRRLDAEEMHQSGDAVLARSLDVEVGRRLAGAGGLRADAGVAGRESAVGQSGPVAPDRGVEAIGPLRVDVVADAVDPLHIRSETRLSREVERHVHAEAAGL